MTNYEVESTGGGFYAYSFTGDEYYVLVSSDGGTGLTDAGWGVGLYELDSDDLVWQSHYTHYCSMDDLAPWAEALAFAELHPDDEFAPGEWMK